MSFKDNEDVHSLLALLRESTSSVTQPAAPIQPPYQPVPNPPVVPSRQQLDSLLSSLSGSTAIPRKSAFDGPGRNTFEPFGPVGAVAGPSRKSYPSNTPAQSTSTSSAKPYGDYAGDLTGASGPAKKARLDDPEWREMGFAKALPILTELLGSEAFMKEVKRMKADQDALERRLWAKQEKIKAEHQRRDQADRDISRISRRPIPLQKQEQNAQMLRLDLQEFYLKTCLPSIDSLASRHQARLEELGVPGLGVGEEGKVLDEKGKVRIRRIMSVIEAAMEE